MAVRAQGIELHIRRCSRGSVLLGSHNFHRVSTFLAILHFYSGNTHGPYFVRSRAIIVASARCNPGVGGRG